LEDIAMIKEYYFSGDGTILFDDQKSVRELIANAFQTFGYYEPMGFGTVTVFQAHHPATDNGWFTNDTSKSCAEEIKCPDCLCFAYHVPGMLYYVEGGWGTNLGNLPTLENPTHLHLRFEDFDHNVAFNGNLTVGEAIGFFKKKGYVDKDADRFLIRPINPYSPPYTLMLSDELLHKTVEEFEASLPVAVTIIDIPENN
jgi:hypothetical protein